MVQLVNEEIETKMRSFDELELGDIFPIIQFYTKLLHNQTSVLYSLFLSFCHLLETVSALDSF